MMDRITDSLRRLLARRRVRKLFKRNLGYVPDLVDPRSYCEKIQWLKLNYLEHHPDVLRGTDKHAARAYVAEAGFPNILPELHGVWDSPEAIGWASLPKQFALKLNNGSGFRHSWLVEDRDAFDTALCVRRIRDVWHKRYGFRKGEFHYARIEPKIIAEEFLGSDIADYKFECYNGVVGVVSAERHRHTARHVRGYYSADFGPLGVRFVGDCSQPERPWQRPPRYDDMVSIAETLAAGQPMVRVDLYNLDGRIYFGELTYAPSSGFVPWDPVEDDFRYGELIDLEPARAFLRARLPSVGRAGAAASFRGR